MPQQIVALVIILFFAGRLWSQKNKKEINQNEFLLWLTFWSVAALGIIFIKQLDYFLHALGFSLSGINFLIYLAVLALFYFIFRLRLGLAKLDRDLTEVARKIALSNKK